MNSATSDLTPLVEVGVDTHGRTHHAAVVDQLGRELGNAQFPATPGGYRRLMAWARAHGRVARAGVEGTGSYGAGLAHYLRSQGIAVKEVNRPDRASRRANGKSDALDAVSAARAVLAGTATGVAKSRTGSVEAVRVLRVARRGAVKARTQAMNQLRALIVTAPEELMERLGALTTMVLVRECARLRPGTTGAGLASVEDPALPATKASLKAVARRYQALTDEIRNLDEQIVPLVKAAAATLLALQGVGPEVAGQLLATAGDNPERLRSEAAFAHLCGVAPIPASSGKTRRDRLNRGGDRAANNALYTIVLVRLQYDARTRTYVERRTVEGLSKPEIIRCLKRHVAREVYGVLRTLPTTTAIPLD
jgi:transposase